jgi:hypothetical protein
MTQFKSILANQAALEQGIEYKVTGERIRGQVVGYHQKAAPLFHSRGAKSSDVTALTPRDLSNVIMGDNIRSRFTIGFEVEKNELHRSAVREYELFCGFEHDSSCGFEAVTHILPLVAASKWRTKVFDMMHKAEKIIDSRYSRADDTRNDIQRYGARDVQVSKCGGHVTLACDNMSSEDLMKKLRKYSGIVYALFRGRLMNKYCSLNLRMHADDSGDGYSSYINGWDRAMVCLPKSHGCVEFRLVSKFNSVADMRERYEFFYILMDTACNREIMSFKAFLKAIKPIVSRMYLGNENDIERVMLDAVDYQLWIDKAVITDRTMYYLTKKGSRPLTQYYNSAAKAKHIELWGDSDFERLANY